MSNSAKYWIKQNANTILLGIICVSVIGSLSLIAIQQAQTKAIAQQTKNIATTQQKQSKQNSEILLAIQKVTLDAKIDNEQKTKIIICMLRVLPSQRTDSLENNCRKAAVAATTGAQSAASESVSATASVPSNSSQASQNLQLLSPQNNPTQSSGQQNNSQKEERTYRECVSTRPGLIKTVTGVITCAL